MMSQEQFIYWLRGFITGKNYICTQDVELLKEELSKVSVVTFMMTQEQFIYWLRGFLSGKNYICTQDVDLLKEELAKVSVVTFSNPTPIISPSTNPPWAWGNPTPIISPSTNPPYWGGPAGTTVLQATADNQIPGSSRYGPKDRSTMPMFT